MTGNILGNDEQEVRAPGARNQRGRIGMRRTPAAAKSFLAALALLCACHRAPPDDPARMSLKIVSPSFPDGGDIPRRDACDTAISPPLAWQAPPAGTRSLALIVADVDALFGPYIHWLVYNLPPDSRQLPEGVPKQAPLPEGSRQGVTSDDGTNYVGPCPPGSSTHRYVFTLYALDCKLNLPPGAKAKELRKAMQGHIRAWGRLTGRYHR